MKTLIQKELRENLKVGLVGLAILALLLASTFRTSAQPALEGMAGATLFFCAIFGALLGWLQAHRENHRDLWDFLIHRPMSRTEIFAAKVIAGMGIYLLAVGLPLLAVIVLVQVPGRVAAPFEWAMTLPATATFLAGIACYFAGMLTGLHQARWYASRGLGLGAGLLVCIAVRLPEFRQALDCILIGGGILAIAAWGSFKSGGYYCAQPTAGKLALTGSMAAGGVVVILFATALFVAFMENWQRSDIHNPPQSYSYVMAKDGTIWKDIDRRQWQEYFGLDGKPIQPIKEKGFRERLSFTTPVTMEFTKELRFNRSYWESGRFFTWLQQDRDNHWYYSYRRQRVLGYDLKTRRYVGSIGPKGFVKNGLLAEDRFDPLCGSQRIITAANVAYLIDFRQRTNTIFFTAPEGEHIGVAKDIYPRGYNWEYTVLASERSVYMLTPDGKLVWKAPYDRNPRDYPRIEVSLLESPDQFALWLMPSNYRNRPIHVDWLTRGQGVVKSVDLPPLPWPSPFNDFWIRAATIAMPPMVDAIWAKQIPKTIIWERVQLSFVLAALCAAAGWLLGRRYKPCLTAQLGWGLFHLLFGLPGLLAFLSVQEWPAREECPKCKKLRTVDHELCEHCGATFAPPQRNGTEIFETLSLRGS